MISKYSIQVLENIASDSDIDKSMHQSIMTKKFVRMFDCKYEENK